MSDYTLSVEINGNAKDLQKTLGEVRSALDRTKASVEGTSSNGSSGILAMAKSFGIAQLATKAVATTMGVLRGAVDGAVSRVDTLNQYPRVLQNMGYSGKDAKASIDALSKGIVGLPTTLDGIVGTTQRLVTVMGDVPKATAVTLALNDAFIASGSSAGDASRGTEQFIQMLSAGKVDMMSWKTLQETMPYALKKTAEAFGFTGKSATKDFYEALKKGDISMDDFANKLVELNKGTKSWHNTALESSKGIQTSWQNIQTAVKTGVGNVISAFENWAKSRGFGDIASNLDKVKMLVSKTFASIVAYVPTAMDSLVALSQKFMEIYNETKPYHELIGKLLAGFLGFKTVTGIVSGVTSTFSKLGGKIGATLDFINRAPDRVMNLAVKFENLSETLSGSSSKMRELGAKIQQVKSLPSNVVASFGLLKDSIKSVGTAMWGLATNPFVLWTVAIVAAVAGLVVLYNKCEWFRDAVNTAFAGLAEFFSNLWQGIVDTAQTVWQVLAEALPNIWNNLVETAKGVWQGLSEALSQMWQGLVQVAQGAWEMIKAVILGPVLIVIDLLTGNWTQLSADLQMIWDSICQAAQSIWDGLGNFFSGYLSGVSTLFIGIWQAIYSSLNAIWQAAVGSGKSLWESLKGATIAIFNETKASVINIANSMKTGAVNVWNSMVDAVKGIVNKVKSAFNALKNIDLASAGRAIMDGFLGGLKGAWGKVKDFVGDIADWIRKHKGPIAYDKRLLIPAGRAIMKGLHGGLITGFKRVEKSVTSMGGQLAQLMDSPVNSSADFRLTVESSDFFSSIDKARKAVGRLKDSFDRVGPLSITTTRRDRQELSRVYSGLIAPNPDYAVASSNRIGRTQPIGNMDSFIVREPSDIHLTVVSELDGREVARGTYPFTKEFLERSRNQQRRRVGEIY